MTGSDRQCMPGRFRWEKKRAMFNLGASSGVVVWPNRMLCQSITILMSTRYLRCQTYGKLSDRRYTVLHTYWVWKGIGILWHRSIRATPVSWHCIGSYLRVQILLNFMLNSITLNSLPYTQPVPKMVTLLSSHHWQHWTACHTRNLCQRWSHY